MFSEVLGIDIIYSIKLKKKYMPGSTQYTGCQGGGSLVVRSSQILITETQGRRCATSEV